MLAGNKGASPEGQVKNMIGDVVTEDEIWACTTCGACQEVMPGQHRTYTKDNRPQTESGAGAK